MAKERTKKYKEKKASWFNGTTILIIVLALIAVGVAYLRFVEIPRINEERRTAELARKKEEIERERLMFEQEEAARKAVEEAIPNWQKMGASRAPSGEGCEWERWTAEEIGVELLMTACRAEKAEELEEEVEGKVVGSVEKEKVEDQEDDLEEEEQLAKTLVATESAIYEIELAENETGLNGTQAVVKKPAKTELRGELVKAKDEESLITARTKLEKENKMVLIAPYDTLTYLWLDLETGEEGWSIEIDEGSIKLWEPAEAEL